MALKLLYLRSLILGLTLGFIRKRANRTNSTFGFANTKAKAEELKELF
jgi:hypothetical protein